jgi:hypothetical protein
MKKNKKCVESASTIGVSTGNTTVGEFINFLCTLPEDATVDVCNDEIKIQHDSFNGKSVGIATRETFDKMYAVPTDHADIPEVINGSELDDTLIEKITRNGYDHLYGCININPEARKVAGTIDNY